MLSCTRSSSCLRVSSWLHFSPRSRLAAQLAEQPGPRESKSTLERGRRYAERIGRFLDAEACEVSQLDDARLLGVDLLQPLQRFVERRQHGLLIAGDGERLRQRPAVESRPSLLRAACTRTLDQNLPHRSRGDADEVPLVVPRCARAREPKVCLVDECRRLQRLPRALAAHVRRREPAQLAETRRRRRAVSIGTPGPI